MKDIKLRGLVKNETNGETAWLEYTPGEKPRATTYATFLVEDLLATGILDSKGKMIFEGDVISILETQRTAFDIDYDKGLVRFEKGAFYIGDSPYALLAHLVTHEGEEDPEYLGEVLGDIYHDETLLKEVIKKPAN